MKKILLLIIAIILSTNTYAQKNEILKRNSFKDKKLNNPLMFSLDDGSEGLITIRKHIGGVLKIVKGYYIQHYDKNLQLVNELEYKVKNNRIKNAFIKNKKLHIIEGQISSFKKTIEYNVLVTDLNNFKFTTKNLLNISKTNFSQYFENISFKSFFNNVNLPDSNTLEEQVFLSETNNYFIINIPLYSNQNSKIKTFVYHNLELAYHKKINQQSKNSFFDYLSFGISDKDGSLYLLGKSFDNQSRRTKKKGKTNYHFVLTKINKQEEKTIKLKEPEKFMRSLSLVHKKNHLSIIGFYGDRKESKYNGVIAYTLNTESLKIEHKKFNPFTEQFLFDKYGDNETTKENVTQKGISNIQLKSINPLDNGDVIITAEEQYITVNSAGTNNVSYTPHFDDIISLRIDNEGNMLWARNINKAQTGYKNSSFTAVTRENRTNIFINCADKIKKLSGDRIKFGHTRAKRSNLYCVTISNDGVIDFEELIDGKDSKVFYNVSNGIISNNKSEIIFFGYEKKNTHLLKIKQ